MKNLSDLCNQKPIFEFEGFIIRPFDEWNLFIENPQGDGAQISKQYFLVWLVRLFNENF